MGFTLLSRRILLLALVLPMTELLAQDLRAFLPQQEDRGSTWWRDGWPELREGARWHRCFETGHYRLLLDTEKVAFPGIGSRDSDWNELAPADLILEMQVERKTYRCVGAAPASRFEGPRLVEGGGLFQRVDLTTLHFQAEDGSRLNSEARFEISSWPDRVALSLEARPGKLAITAGESAFGKIGGGYGLDGTGRFQIPAEAAPLKPPFTFSFHAFVPVDFKAGPHAPWLLCRGQNETTKGNLGVFLHSDGRAEARLNLEGGGPNQQRIKGRVGSLQVGKWNHFAFVHDGKTLRFHANGRDEGSVDAPGTEALPALPLTFGGRGDDAKNKNFPFRGIIDEIRIAPKALPENELRHLRGNPRRTKTETAWGFREDGEAREEEARENWKSASLRLGVRREGHGPDLRWSLPEGQAWPGADFRQIGVVIDPITLRALPTDRVVKVRAKEVATGKAPAITHERLPGWHRIDLSGFEPIPPAGQKSPSNDALERFHIHLHNPTDSEQLARLVFSKDRHGIRQRMGSSVTGMSAILRDLDGHPTGIPVQISKNWHSHEQGGKYNGQWFHGISQIRLPAKADLHLEFNIAYGHWGGLPAASHAQLSLVGWGGNQRWDEAAIGAWGESICYDINQSQADCTVTDIRPLLVISKKGGRDWGWTNNHGGGDFFRFLDPEGKRRAHASMQADSIRQGPCLTEVRFHGSIANTGLQQQITTSLVRSDDIMRAIYRLRLRATKPVDFSRLALFQMGTDRYHSTQEKKIAIGHAGGVAKEWDAQWGGDGSDREEPIQLGGTTPWISMHQVQHRPGEIGARANRGLIVREWKAVLGGKESAPWMRERGVGHEGHDASSLVELIPPPGLTRLEAGDSVDAVLELVLIPQKESDYYGPSEQLKTALRENANSWKMVHREAAHRLPKVEMQRGTLQRSSPDLRIAADGKRGTELTVEGGYGFQAVTFTGLPTHRGWTLFIDGQPLDQSVHGRDFWQTDFDPGSGTWSITWNVELTGKLQKVELRHSEP